MTKSVSDSEQSVREAFDAGKFELAASLALEAYGAEILRFLMVRVRGWGDAQDVFSLFAEDLWVGLPKFSWRCRMRTWAYALARNAANRYATSPQQRFARKLKLSCPDALAQHVEQIQSTTRKYRQTAVKDRFRALREQLDSDDQLLLVLRIDRGLSWRDLAITVAGDPDLNDDALLREAARLRKAFERVKAEIKRLAQREGLLDCKE
jgi:RNA polymerase sigma-70 factor (ECF subfamily)